MVVPGLTGQKLAKAKLVPVWYDHMTRSELLDGDASFLHKLSQDVISGAKSLPDPSKLACLSKTCLLLKCNIQQWICIGCTIATTKSQMRAHQTACMHFCLGQASHAGHL
jgi:hypothetical protein